MHTHNACFYPVRGAPRAHRGEPNGPFRRSLSCEPIGSAKLRTQRYGDPEVAFRLAKDVIPVGLILAKHAAGET